MLQVEDVRSSYGRIEAVKGVSLDILKGEIVCLIGSNGAGKTTLLRAISGVQPVTSGTITFNGESIDRLSSRARVARGIAQSPEGRQVFGPLSVEENLRMGAYCRPGDLRDRMEKVYAIFPVLAERRRSFANTLSGGQQQMLAIGRALMADPALLILDEPSLGLSPQLVGFVFETVKSLNEKGLTILLVEQNARAALEVSDRAFVMVSGRIARAGLPSELLDDVSIRKAYLGG